MSVEHGSLAELNNQEQPVYGVVLTAGARRKRAADFAHPWIDEDGEAIYPWKYRIEPGLEGKMRLLAALTDLVDGRVSKIFIAGGARNYHQPLANIYFDYAQRLVRRYGLSSDQVVVIEGGVNTETDLEKTKKALRKEGFRGDIVLYSSGYHFERRSIERFRRKFKLGNVETQAAETKIQKRHRLYQKLHPYIDPQTKDIIDWRPLSWLILNPNHLSAMRARNKKMDRIPQLALNIGAYIARR